MALRELLDRLPSSRGAEAHEFAGLRARLDKRPEADYDEFQYVLRRFHDQGGVRTRPILIVDEFERLIDPAAKDGFPYPDFFNGMRALITADLLAMIVVSRRPLADYFGDPARPNSLTSTFPNYFTPLTLPPLDEASAEALLLQPSDHPLTLAEAPEARRWAGGHPCHLQVAGAAYYEAKTEGHSREWAYRRREEIKSQSCMVSTPAPSRLATQHDWPWRGLRAILQVLRAIFWVAPRWIGRLARRLGIGINQIAEWIVGIVLIILVVLVLLGVAKATDVLEMLKKGLGG
jgi:hypothetical protein